MPLLFTSGAQKTEDQVLINEANLQGTWISEDDVRHAIDFSDDIKSDLYDGEVLLRGGYRITDEDQLIVEEDTGVFTYTIVTLGYSKLELMYLPRGNILRYYKGKY